ncbi:MAG TPA: DUF4282 domain-containing protein [Phycisphaerales bacterium]|nr:DUF4282 domain-containing protein [Phycisphaerales bacterium]
MRDFLVFRRMVTPLIIQIIFWGGCALAILGGVVIILQGMDDPINGRMMVLQGAGLLIAGPIVVRVLCELLIVIFRINATLTDIYNQTRRSQPATSTQPPSNPMHEPAAGP